MFTSLLRWTIWEHVPWHQCLSSPEKLGMCGWSTDLQRNQLIVRMPLAAQGSAPEHFEARSMEFHRLTERRPRSGERGQKKEKASRKTWISIKKYILHWFFWPFGPLVPWSPAPAGPLVLVLFGALVLGPVVPWSSGPLVHSTLVPVQWGRGAADLHLSFLVCSVRRGSFAAIDVYKKCFCLPTYLSIFLACNFLVFFRLSQSHRGEALRPPPKPLPDFFKLCKKKPSPPNPPSSFVFFCGPPTIYLPSPFRFFFDLYIFLDLKLYFFLTRIIPQIAGSYRGSYFSKVGLLITEIAAAPSLPSSFVSLYLSPCVLITEIAAAPASSFVSLHLSPCMLIPKIPASSFVSLH